MSQLLRKMIRNAVMTIPVAIAFVDCVAYVAKVEGVSMQPSLNPHGSSHDFVLLNRWTVRDFNVSRGDIVALKSPRDPDQKLIKRIIGVEGDVVRTLSYKKRYVSIPEGYCWVEGDHSKQSMDSNFFGPVAIGLITARASHIVWPPSRWRVLHPDLPEKRQPVMFSTLQMDDVDSDDLETKMLTTAS